MAASIPVSGGDPVRDRVLALLRRHGWNATSFQILEDGFQYWFPEGDDDACVAYVDTGWAWVAAGSPVAATARLGTVAAAFTAAAASAGRRASFFATERRFEPGGAMRALLIGEQPVWDPAEWPAVVQGSRTLREQLRRARAKGVTVRAVSGDELSGPALRGAVERLITRWLASRPMAPMGFLVDLQPFAFAAERRYFVAERPGGGLVGFLAAAPVYARRGWLLEDLLRDPRAPNGTAELLVDAAMTALATEGSRYVTLGLAPLAGPVTGALGAARDLMAALYDFRGVYAFRAKLRPRSWDPIHLVYPVGRRPDALAATAALLDALAAFARGNLAGFGVETLLRGPALVVRALAVLLVPWTVLLALTEGRHFPDPAVQRGWVAFDVALIVALLALASRWRRWLGLLLALAVTADAAVTWTEVLLYNVPRARGWAEWVGLAVAALAPTGAAAILWKAGGRRVPLDD
jgi:phosphatidylglycerol lysyltransferase